MTQFADLKGQFKRPEKSVFLCMRGDLQAEFEDLERDLEAARSKPKAPTLGGLDANDEAKAIAQRLVALRAEMHEHSVKFLFRGLTKRAYSDLIAAHPPTEEQVADDKDVNWETFPGAVIVASAVDPIMTEADGEELADMVTQAQWNTLWMAARTVNATQLDIPNSFAASAVLASSKKSSK